MSENRIGMTRFCAVSHGEAVECNEKSRNPGSTRGRWFAGFVLVGYLIALSIHGMITHRHDLGADLRSFEVEDLLQPLDWIVVVAVDGLIEVGKFAVVGCLVSLAFGRSRDGCTLIVSLARKLLLLLTGVGVSAAVHWLASGQLGGPAILVPPLAGFFLGAWIGSAWLCGSRALLRLVSKLGLVILLLAACVAGLACLALDETPLAFEVPRVTSAEKRRLVEVLRSGREAEEQVQRLDLSEEDVNSLIAIAASHGPLDGKGKVVIEEGGFSAQLSLKTPFRSYVNVQGACRMEVTSGNLKLAPQRLRIGRVKIPKLILDACLPLMVGVLLGDPDIARGVALIDSLRLLPGAGRMVYQSGGYGKNHIHSLLAKLLQKPDTRMETEIYIRHLINAAGTLPEGEKRFVAFVQTAFELAQKRSADRNPVMENRGAILALAVLLGHHRMGTLVGPVMDADLRKQARRSVGPVTLRGREDWTKHFFVSAGLTLLSNHDLSDGAGLFKEGYDAGKGGSGFSFADLLADRAGSRFALAATRDAESARKMQKRLSAGFGVKDVFPDAVGLPEGIPAAEFQSAYGGIGGQRYSKMVAEIERRLGECALLRAR